MRDAESFDEFYRSTSARLMRYGYAVVGDLTEAQDVVQEAYTRAWQRWRTVAAHPHPEAWVRLVVTRLATDRWRRLARWQAILHRSGPPESVHPPNEDTVVVVAALRRLPVAHRQALALHYLFDQSVAEIAQETGVAVGTVTSWLSRGRAGLAQALTGTASPGPPGRPARAPTLVAPAIATAPVPGAPTIASQAAPATPPTTSHATPATPLTASNATPAAPPMASHATPAAPPTADHAAPPTSSRATPATPPTTAGRAMPAAPATASRAAAPGQAGPEATRPAASGVREGNDDE